MTGPASRSASAIALLLAAAAVVLTQQVAVRGFLAFDQSILFDAGYRIASGQVLYRDFVSPSGPLVIFLQGAVFRLFGVGYGPYVATAAVQNAIAVLCVFFALRRLFPRALLWPTAGAGLTALWFYPLFGTPWFENTAYLLGLLGVLLLVSGRFAERTPGAGWAAGAGVAAGLAFLAKQNAGALVGAYLAGVLLATRITAGAAAIRALAAFAAGGAAVLAGFAAWVAVFADFELFVRHFWEIPASVGRDRFGSIPLREIISGEMDLIVLGSSACAGIAALLALLNLDEAAWRRRLAAAAVVTGAAAVQAIMTLTTKNLGPNTQLFMGLILAAAAALVTETVAALELRPRGSVGVRLLPRRVVTLGITAGFLVLAAGAAAYAARVAARRDMHDIFVHSRFSGHCDVPLLDAVIWGRPTAYDGVELRCEDLAAVHRTLREEGGRFFVLGETTILYAMTGQPSLSPLLWLHQGLTYPDTYDARVDRWMVERIEAEGVDVVVVETKQFLSTADVQLAYFVELAQLLETRFMPAERFGLFQLYRRRPAHEAP